MSKLMGKSKKGITDSGTAKKRKRDYHSAIRSQGLLLMLLILVFFFRNGSNYFFTWTNFLTIAVGATALGVMAAAQTPLIISGGIDVSVGSVVALTTVLIGKFLASGVPIGITLLLVLIIGSLIGAVNGFIVVQLGINPFITTLGTMSIFSGLAFILSSGQTVSITDNNWLNWFLYTEVFKIPILVIILATVMIIAYMVERLTVVGRYIYAIGGNREAARLSGISVKLLPLSIYMVSGLAASFAGIILTSQLGAASPQIGTSYLLSVVTAVILGGTSLAGGRGSIVGTGIAVAILATLSNGFAQLRLPSYGQTTALGVALIVAVLVDQTTQKLKK
jgi:ribose transport system permease protein